MNFVIGVFGCPASSAFLFGKALKEAGHNISQIFFYGDGIFALSSQWQEISESLLVCQTSSIKRQITLPDGFSFSGLGQFMSALQNTDRYIVFGNSK